MGTPSTNVRSLGLEPRLVRAIEELQRSAQAPQAASLSASALSQVQQLIDAGPSTPGGGSETIDTSPPPALEGFVADGGYGIIFLRWTPSVDRRYGYAEIWRSATNNIGTAVLVGTAAGSVYIDQQQDSQTRYYWIRPVNKWNDAVKGPYTPNGTTGLAATTAPDVEYMLDLLAGEITTSELATALNTRINLIDAADTVPGSVAARIKSEQDARTAGDSALATSIAALAVSSDAGFDWKRIWYFDSTAESWTANGGSATVSGGLLRAADHATDPYFVSPAALGIAAATYAQIKLRLKKTGSPTWEGRLYWKRTGDATWDVGRSTTIAEPTWTGGFGSVTFTAAWDGTIDQIRVDVGTISDGTDRHEIDWAAIGRAAPGASVAQVTDIESAKIGYCTIGSATTDYTTRAACEAAGGTWNVGLPMATAVRQVAVSDGSTSIALEERFTAQKTTNDALKAQWTIKVDANGRVGGIGLASTVPTVGAGTVDFAVVADKFYVVAPASGGSTYPPASDVPFYVLTSTTTIDGVSVPAGVYINEANIRNAAITGAQIRNATITDANIASLNAAKITVDSLVGRLAVIQTGDFQTIFADKAFIVTANIGDGQITNAKIGNVIESTNFGPTTGWQLNKAGGATFRNVTITDANGNIVLASGSGIRWDQIIGDKQFSDTFASIGKWADVQGAGAEVSIATVADAVTGNTVLRIGNGAGNDYGYVVCDKLVPFDATALYRVRARVRRVAGVGTVLIGFVGVGANGDLVNLNGANSIANQHFFGASGANPAESWTLYEGYFKGYGANTGAGTPASPFGVHPSVRWMKPMLAANSLNLAGITEFDDFEIAIVDGAMATLDRLSASNVSTYIENGAIGNLQIANEISSNDWSGSGSTTGWNINKAGNATFNNTTVRGVLRGSLFVSEDLGKVIDLRPGTPSGYLMNLGPAKILADGSTRFNNKVASGVQVVQQPIAYRTETITVTGGEGGDSTSTIRVPKPLRVVVQTNVQYTPDTSLGVFQPLALATGSVQLVASGTPNTVAANFDLNIRVGVRQPVVLNAAGTDVNTIYPALGGLIILDIEILYDPTPAGGAILNNPYIESVSWELYRIT